MLYERNREFIEQDLKVGFQITLDDKVNRSLRMPLQQIAPNQYFAAPTRECFDMFVEGYFYGCITLVQAVAEGIVRFLVTKNPAVQVSDMTDYGQCVNALQRDRSNPVISDKAFAAFGSIRGPRKGKEDRNIFHHLDESIELDKKKLEARAEQCIKSLCEIENEIFAYTSHQGKMVFKNPQYWPPGDEQGDVRVMLRL